MNDDLARPVPDEAGPAQPPPVVPAVHHPPGRATRGQRIALLVGLVVVAWLALQLFASVLLPFVAAAGIAYVLDPPTRAARQARHARGRSPQR